MRFFRRRRPAGGESPAARGAQPLPPGVAFDALTEEWRLVGDTSAVALVNRSYVKRVEQIDRRTYEAVRPLPGRPLGGTSQRTP